MRDADLRPRSMHLPVLALLLAACAPRAFAAAEAAPATTAAKRPNIVFIMTDDHAWQSISAYGSRLNETPNIDRIAAEGMRFDRAYVTDAICAPSRAVILTGKHSHLNGVRNNVNVFDGSQQTVQSLLHAAGYRTALIGKWHLKSDPTGFDYWRVLPDQGQYYQPDFRTPDGTVRLDGYVTDIITDLAIDWIRQNRDPERPFLLMYQHKAPHREWLPSPEHLTDFKDAPLPEPATLFDDYAGRGSAAAAAEMRIADHMGFTNDMKLEPELVKELGYHDFLGWYEGAYLTEQERMTPEQKRAWDAVYGPINEWFAANRPHGETLTHWMYQRYMQDYLATVASVDDNVGRLLDYLEEAGLADNTIVVYTSDQGFYLGEHGWFDKRFMYEESFRTPFIVRWPGVVEPGSVNTDLVQNLDYAPTLLDAAGVPVPDDMQGVSLVPLLSGTGGVARDALYYHYYEYPGIHAVKRHYGIRTDRYKLIHFYYDIDEWELYDLEKDPHEMHDVYGDPAYAKVRERLTKRLAELRAFYGDSEALDREFLDADLAEQ